MNYYSVLSCSITAMGSSACFVVFILTLISLTIIDTATGDPRTTVAGQFCNNTSAASAAIYADNFVPAMDNLSSLVNSLGYGTTVRGSNPNAVYGLAQCYGDLNSVDCKLCFSEIRSKLPACYPKSGGMLFLDGCFGRYENFSFFNEIFYQNDTTVCSLRKGSSDWSGFRQVVKEAIKYVSSQARNNQGFSIGSASNSGSTVYALAQCWRNLNYRLCSSCLDAAALSILSCSPATEGRALFAGCFMRYSTRLFWNVNETPSSGGKNNTVWVLLGCLFGGILIMTSVFFIGKKRVSWYRNKITPLRDLYGPELAAIISQSNLNFKYEKLRKATNNFSILNKLGQGSYGIVYKGVLSDGKNVAVKRLFLNTRQWINQFFNEVDLINQVRHKSLVRLLGCSVDGPESLLVYEYCYNRSLDLFIFGESHDKTLDWQQRFDIIQGVAEGLSYLHEESETRIIHRDIKASNILLDEKLKPKITDFGLARSFTEDQTHLTTGIAGTLGYLAPEYIVHGHLTEKADVYSFGVLVLEVVTGKRCNSPVVSHSELSLLAQVWNHYQANTLGDIIDARIPDNREIEEIFQMFLIGLLCTQANPQSRPAMVRVVEILRSKMNNQELVLSDPPFLDFPFIEDFQQGNGSNQSSANVFVSWISAR